MVTVIYTNLFYGCGFGFGFARLFFSTPVFYGASIFLSREGTLANVTNIHSYHVNKWEMSVTY